MKQFCPKCERWYKAQNKNCPKCGAEMLNEEKYTQVLENISGNSTPPHYHTPNTHINQDVQTNVASESYTNTHNPDIQLPQNSSSPSDFFTRLDVNVGIARLLNCSPQENAQFSEMQAQGKPLPPNIIATQGCDNQGNRIFQRVQRQIPPEKDILFALEKIYGILSFIKTVIIVGLVILGCFGFIALAANIATDIK